MRGENLLLLFIINLSYRGNSLRDRVSRAKTNDPPLFHFHFHFFCFHSTFHFFPIFRFFFFNFFIFLFFFFFLDPLLFLTFHSSWSSYCSIPDYTSFLYSLPPFLLFFLSLSFQPHYQNIKKTDLIWSFERPWRVSEWLARQIRRLFRPTTLHGLLAHWWDQLEVRVAWVQAVALVVAEGLEMAALVVVAEHQECRMKIVLGHLSKLVRVALCFSFIPSSFQQYCFSWFPLNCESCERVASTTRV